MNRSEPAVQFQFPLYLHIIPFNSTAITHEINGWNASMASGSAIVDFNLDSNSPFLLGVTDSKGQGVGPVTDIQHAQSSSDTSCLSNGTLGPPPFQVDTTFDNSSCPNLTVSWENITANTVPSIIGFSPGQFPVKSQRQESSNSATFHGKYTSLSRVVVLYDDGTTPPRTSTLLTVGGTDRSSCITRTDSVSGSSGNSVGPGMVIAYTFLSVIAAVLAVFLMVRLQRWRNRVPQEGVLPTSSPADGDPVAVTQLDPIAEIDTPHPSQPSIHEPDAAPKEQPSDETEKNVILLPRLNTTLHASPVMAMKSPGSARRRSIAALSIGRLSSQFETDESYLSQFTPSEYAPTTLPPDNLVPIPDSPTLPEITRISFNLPFPSTPRSSLRPKSQRSEKRSNYLKLDPSSGGYPSELSRKSPSVSSGVSTHSWKKRSLRASLQ